MGGRHRLAPASRAMVVAALVAVPVGIPGGADRPAQAAAGSRPAPAAGAPAAGAPGGQAWALGEARRSGHRVEVLDRRDETSSLFANPDGSLTLESAAFPVRVRRGTGWVPVDLRLHHDASGMISPQAAPFGLRLAAGGRAPLATLVQGDREVALSWPGPLPSPVLAGDSATYPEVLPRVDLVVRATEAGFAEVLVVKTAAAAANPVLGRIRFAVATRGVSVRTNPAGGFVAVDGTGATAFTSAQPLMWDSASSMDGAVARARGPAPSSHTSAIPTTVTATSVTLAPDRTLITARATRYPVYIDPSISVNKLAWAEVWKQLPNSTDINPSHDAMVGYENDPCCPPDDTVRAFWRMDTARVNGKHILSATFRTYENWAWSCQARVVEAWWTGAITSSLTWNNQSWIEREATANTAKRSGDGNCPAGNVEFNLTALVQRAASQNWPDATIGLKAQNETDPYGWKRFANNPVLAIDYNSYPPAPTGLTVDGKACGSGTYVGTLTPTMRADVSDPDAGTVLDVSMYWAPAGSAVNETDKVVQAAVASGSTAAMAVPPGRLADAASYYWQARDTDRIDTSPLSGQCAFTIDVAAPGQPAVSSPDYPADGNFHGGVGRTGSFTFAADGSGDVVAYRYGWADPPTTEVAAGSLGGAATVTATPASQGINTLYVQAKDRAGNLSGTMRYVFFAGGPTAPVARWLGQPGSGATLPDDSGNGHTATLTGATSRAAGRDGTANVAVHFDGATGYAATAGPVAASDSSFAVAAWVRLDSTANYASVLCQQGVTNSGMLLQYDKAGNRWAMTNQTTDSSSAAGVRAGSAVPRVGVWTHLAGTYDAGPGTLSLYVNGAPAGSVSTRIGWNAAGAFLIGAEKFAGAVQSYFPGSVADVRVWDRMVYPAEIQAITAATTPVGTWALDYGPGDSSGYGHDLSPAGGVGWSDGYNFLGGASLDGTGVLATSAPVVLTDQSFSVAAWVRLAGTGTARTAVCQQGNRVCSFYLQYSSASNRWAFTVKSSDVDNASGPVALSSSAPTLGVWTHLVGVYDAGAQRVRLYVNGQLADEVPVTAPTFNATGPLTAGRAKWNGSAVDWWVGDIDDVRVYLGVLTDAQIVDLFNQ